MTSCSKFSKLSAVCEVFTDGNWIETKDQATDGIRLVQTGNVGIGFFKNRRDKARFISEETFERLKCFEVLENDCLVSRLPDPVGRVCIIPKTGDKMITAVDCSIIRFDETKVIPNFFMYYGQSQKYFRDVENACSGATRKRISRKNLGKIEVPTPPLDEQKRIVAVLDAAFDGLTRARANVEANLQNARELFESELKVVFSNSDEGWKRCALSKVTSKIGSGATPRGGAASYKAEGISLIRSLNVHDRDFRYKKLAFINDEQAKKLSNVVIQDYDVLLNITGASVARCCIVPLKVLPARVNQHVSILRVDPNIINPDFLCYELTSEPFKKRLLKTGEEGGATRQAITKAQLHELSVVFPEDLSEQKYIVATLNNAENKVKQLEAHYQSKLADLDELRQSLLQKAFVGELT